jgi:hypothetical protein
MFTFPLNTVLSRTGLNIREQLDQSCGRCAGIVTTFVGPVKVKVKFSRYRPEQAPDFLDFRHNEGGKVVTLTHRLSLPPGVFLVVIFRS